MFESVFDRLFDRPGQRISLDRLRSFLRVADAGGIARAAPRDASAQSQLSRQLTELESFFGQALSERRGRERVLTPAGERLAQLTRETFQQLSDLASERPGDTVRFELGAGDSLLHWWVIPRVGRILATLPRVSLSLTSLATVDIVDRIEAARLDVGLLRTSELPKSREVTTRLLGPIEYAVYVRKDVMAQARARSLEAVLRSVPLALQQSESALNERLRPAGGELPVALACETFTQACRAVQSGVYASLLPVMARSELPASEFAELELPASKEAAVKVALAWHPRLVRQRPRAKALIDALARGLSLRGSR
jgi:DNA-binding transcriptional LysR family regulator